MKLNEILVEYGGVGDFDPSDAYDDYDASKDPDVEKAFNNEYVSVYNAIEEVEMSEEQYNQLNQLVVQIKQCGEYCSLEDLYLRSDWAQKIKAAMERPGWFDSPQNVQKGAQWLAKNSVTFEEWIESDDGEETIRAVRQEKAEYEDERNDPYGFRGLSRSDFM